MPDIKKIDHIHIFVQNRIEAEQWYECVLGFKPVPKFERWAIDGGPLTIANTSGHIHLALFEGISQQSRTTVAFQVDGTAFLQWHAHLSTILVYNIKPVDHELSWSLYFRDPDNNPYEITSYDYDWLCQNLTNHHQ